MNEIPELLDHWQELVTRCGFTVLIDADGVFVSENESNGRTGRFPDGISAVSAFHLEIIENCIERIEHLESALQAAQARAERLSAPVSAPIRPRRIMISHAQGDSDVVAIYGDLPNQWLRTFDDDESAEEYIASGLAAKELKVKDAITIAARKEKP